MAAEDSLREGNLEQCLAEVQQQVRTEPSNARHRIFLFQLLSVMGDWNRALTQLNVLGDMDASSLAMAQMYREALRCESLRSEIFAGKRSPVVFGEPEAWLAHQMEALRLMAEGLTAQAKAMRDSAFEEAPATSGTIDGEPFEWIADADGRLGPVLEAIVNGKYYWVPFHRIREIRLEKPADLRDVVWTPAQFVWANGGDAVGLIPTRYSGSEMHPDSALRLARRTDWVEHAQDLCAGLGQRMIATDAGDHALMDVRQIVLGEAASAPPGPA